MPLEGSGEAVGDANSGTKKIHILKYPQLSEGNCQMM